MIKVKQGLVSCTRISLMMLALAICPGAKAENVTTGDGVSWIYELDDGKARLVSVKNASGNVEVPSTLGGFPVVSIGDKAFYGCLGLTGVTLPDGVTSIGYMAFEDCCYLTFATIPQSVTNIGARAFRYAGLESVTLPEGVLSIGESAFGSCKGMRSVVIPQSVRNIGSYAFFNCQNLGSVAIPQGVSNIADGMFSGCGKLTSVSLPQGVSRIGHSAFYGCVSLPALELPSSVTNIGFSAFRDCWSLASMSIPNGVTIIEVQTFYGCPNLVAISIPQDVTSIGDHAFYECNSLKEVILPKGLASIGWDAFRRCRRLVTVEFPEGVTSIGDGAFDECDELKSVMIPASLEHIGFGAFHSCGKLSEFIVAKDNSGYSSKNGLLLTKDGQSIIAGVNGNVIVPEDVTSIAGYAFYNLYGLLSVTIPKSVTKIDEHAFTACYGLQRVFTEPGDCSRVKSLMGYMVGSTVEFLEQGSIIVPSDITGGKELIVELAWIEKYSEFKAKFGSDVGAAMAAKTGKIAADGREMAVWEDYVAGTDPTNPKDVFKVESFGLVNGVPTIRVYPDLGDKRSYTTFGKQNMGDDWSVVNGNAEQFRFFKVKVEMK